MTQFRFFQNFSLTFALGLGVSIAFAGPAKTPPEDDSISVDSAKERRDWMNKGNAEYVQKHWEAARDNYLKAWAIKHHYTIAANIADVEMRLGHYAEAAGYLKYALANVPEALADKRRAAEELLLECRNHLTAVRVAVDVTDATILVDGKDVGQTPLREDLLLEPGKHIISVAKQGYGNQTKELSAEGSQVQITLTLEKAGPSGMAPSSASPLPPSDTSTSRQPTSAWRIGSYIGFGVAAVGVGAGTYFLVKSGSTSSEADNAFGACKPNCSNAQQANIRDMDSQSAHQHNAGVVSYVMGGIGLATGLGLLVLEPTRPQRGSAAYVRPYVGATQAGVVGAF